MYCFSVTWAYMKYIYDSFSPQERVAKISSEILHMNRVIEQTWISYIDVFQNWFNFSRIKSFLHHILIILTPVYVHNLTTSWQCQYCDYFEMRYENFLKKNWRVMTIDDCSILLSKIGCNNEKMPSNIEKKYSFVLFKKVEIFM